MASGKPVKLAFKDYEPRAGVDGNLNPLIFLHDLTLAKENWRNIPQIIANATGRKAYVLDARNHGASECSDHWNLQSNADDLLHFMGSHNIRRAILVGHSMGGVTAMKVALKKPALVEKVILVDVLVRNQPPELLKYHVLHMSLYRKALELAPSDLDEDGVKKYVLDFILQSLPKEMAELRTTIKEGDYRHMICLRRLPNGRYAPEPNLIAIEKAFENPENAATNAEGVYEGPAFFIYGKTSPLPVGADQEHIKQFFPQAIFEGIEDASHAVHIHRPLEFIESLLKALS